MKTKGVFVTGIGTEVGKTVVSALLTAAWRADYWKPVQAGDLDRTDSHKVKQWAAAAVGRRHPEAYRLQLAASPHAAAEAEGIDLQLADFQLPATDNFLVVEGAGGLYVPLNRTHTMLDLIERLGLPVVLVSRHYLGSINHTLLSLGALRERRIPVAGLVFNGTATPATETVIYDLSGIAPAFRLDPVPVVDAAAIREWTVEHEAALEALRVGVEGSVTGAR